MHQMPYVFLLARLLLLQSMLPAFALRLLLSFKL